MGVQIEMTAAQWHTLLGYLDPSSPAFGVVKNVIEVNEAPVTTPLARVVLSCSETDAATLLETAQKSLPEVTPEIRKALQNRDAG